MINIAILMRKSPTDKKEIDKSLKKQEELIRNYIFKHYSKDNIHKIQVFKDVARGDNDEERKQLHNFFNDINSFDYAVCLNVDRFSRSYLGLKYVYEYFIPSKCVLKFVEDIDLYSKENEIDPEKLFLFGIMCLVSQKELMNIRRRTQEGRERAKLNNKKLSKQNIIEKNPILKEQVSKLKKKGLSYKEISDKLNLSKTMIFNILKKY